jgi:7-keto-8-aminopelargonate synthetase-like enzyme
MEGSRFFVGSTPVPLPLASAALKAVSILTKNSKLRERLRANTNYVRRGLSKIDVPVTETSGPIIAVHAKDSVTARALRRALFAAGIFPPLIQYPGGPSTGFFRFVISSEHSKRQLDNLVSVLSRFREGMVPES